MLLERLLYVLAARVTGVLTPSKLCSELGLAQPTVDRYVSYLERAFLVFVLPNYSGREATAQKRGRKLYFVDGAVRNAALQRGLAPLSNPVEMGALVENLVASTLRSLGTHTGTRLYHWRDGTKEIDLVFDHHDRPLALEIASSPDHSRGGLRAFVDRHPRFAGRAYLVAPQLAVTRPSTSRDGIGTLPLDVLLVAAGVHADRALHGAVG